MPVLSVLGGAGGGTTSFQEEITILYPSRNNGVPSYEMNQWGN